MNLKERDIIILSIFILGLCFAAYKFGGTGVIDITGAQTANVDLYIGGIWYYDLQLWFQVCNFGSIDSPAVEIKATSPVKSYQTNAGIVKGQSCSGFKSVSLVSVGLNPGHTQSISIAADPDNRISETNEQNNILTKTITTINPELYVQHIYYPCILGTECEHGFWVVVCNSAGASIPNGVFSGNLEVELRSSEGSAKKQIGIGSGCMSYRFGAEEIGLSVEDSADVTAVADVNNAVKESDETNNQKTQSITVSTGADLDVKIRAQQGCFVSPNDPETKVCERTDFSGDICNIGPFDLTNVELKVSADTGYNKIFNFPTIARGACKTQYIYSTMLGLGDGDHVVLTYEADPDNKIAEIDETNNKDTREFYISLSKNYNLYVDKIFYGYPSPDSRPVYYGVYREEYERNEPALVVYHYSVGRAIPDEDRYTVRISANNKEKIFDWDDYGYGYGPEVWSQNFIPISKLGELGISANDRDVEIKAELDINRNIAEINEEDNIKIKTISFECVTDADCSSGTCVDGKCVAGPPGVCSLTNAYWSDDDVEEDEDVDLIVTGSNCDGKSASFKIYGENDEETEYTVSNCVFSSGKCTKSWVAEYEPDEYDEDEDEKVELYFIATVDSMTKTSGTLEIEEEVEVCTSSSDPQKCSDYPTPYKCRKDLCEFDDCEWNDNVGCYEEGKCGNFVCEADYGENAGNCDDCISEELGYEWDCPKYGECINGRQERGACRCIGNRCSEAPAGEKEIFGKSHTKTCVDVEKFPFFDNFSLMVSVLILIGYYLIRKKLRHIRSFFSVA